MNGSSILRAFSGNTHDWTWHVWPKPQNTSFFFYVTGENKIKKVETFPVFSTIFSCSLIKESGSFYLAELWYHFREKYRKNDAFSGPVFAAEWHSIISSFCFLLDLGGVIKKRLHRFSSTATYDWAIRAQKPKAQPLWSNTCRSPFG